MSKCYVIYEQIGNFADEVYYTDIWNDAQEYLTRRWWDYCAENGVDLYDEAEEELFYSYFSIDEVDAYCIKDKDGYILESAMPYNHAVNHVNKLENDDRNDGIYEEGFYIIERCKL